MPLTGKNITRGVQVERLDGPSAGNGEVKTGPLVMGAVANGDLAYESVVFEVGFGAVAGPVVLTAEQADTDTDAEFKSLSGALTTETPNSLVLLEVTKPGRDFIRLKVTRAAGAEITHITALRTPLEVPAVHGSAVSALTHNDHILSPEEVAE